MTEPEFRDICLSFPAVGEGIHYRKPAFLVGKKFLTRLRAEDGSAVLMDIGFDEREMLMEAEPDTFHLTWHYKEYDCVLARIATLHPGSLRAFLERRWRKIAPKAAVKAFDAAKG